MDIEEYRVWVKQNLEDVYRIGYHLTRDSQLAQNIMVHVFVEIYEEMLELKKPSYKNRQELCYMVVKRVRDLKCENKQKEQEENV